MTSTATATATAATAMGSLQKPWATALGSFGSPESKVTTHKRRPRRPHLRRVQSVGMGVTSWQLLASGLLHSPRLLLASSSHSSPKSLHLTLLSHLFPAPRCGRSSCPSAPGRGGRSAHRGPASVQAINYFVLLCCFCLVGGETRAYIGPTPILLGSYEEENSGKRVGKRERERERESGSL